MDEPIKVKAFLEVITDPDRLRIIDSNTKEVLTVCYAAMLPEEYKDKTMVRYRATPEIRHRQWKERGLDAPMEPDILANYRFSDLEMKLYYDIYI